MKTAALMVALVTSFNLTNAARSDEVDLKFGSFIKINAALANKGVNGIDDA